MNVDHPIFCASGKGAVSPGLVEMSWNGTITWMFDLVQYDQRLMKVTEGWKKACGDDNPIYSGPEYKKFVQASKRWKVSDAHDNVIQRWNQPLQDTFHCNSMHMSGVDTEVVWHCNRADKLFIVSRSDRPHTPTTTSPWGVTLCHGSTTPHTVQRCCPWLKT